MNSENEDVSTVIYYVTMVGMYGVGKTSIITKLKKNIFAKSYKPTEDKKILKHTLTETVKDLEENTVKISFKDSSGLSHINSSDQSFLSRKAHILCFVYDYDNIDTYQCIKHLLETHDELYSSNRIIMVLRNKIDNKTIINESEDDCNKQFDEITSINEEIMFIKNFSAKNKSADKIEKIFIRAIQLYRDYYGEQPPPGPKRKSSLKSDTYNAAPNTSNSERKTNKKKKKKKKQSDNDDKKSRTNNKSNDAAPSNGAECGCVIL